MLAHFRMLRAVATINCAQLMRPIPSAHFYWLRICIASNDPKTCFITHHENFGSLSSWRPGDVASFCVIRCKTANFFPRSRTKSRTLLPRNPPPLFCHPISLVFPLYAVCVSSGLGFGLFRARIWRHTACLATSSSCACISLFSVSIFSLNSSVLAFALLFVSNLCGRRFTRDAACGAGFFRLAHSFLRPLSNPSAGSSVG